MEKFFNLIGKVTLILMLVGGAAYGAYMFGRTTTNPNPNYGAAATTAAPTPTMDPGLKPESLPEGFIPRKAILAGLESESGLGFTQYQLNIPEDWQVNHETTNEGTWVDTLTLSKDFSSTGEKTQLKIFQAATGGALCLYPGDDEFEGPSSRYSEFTPITTADGNILRRSWTQDIDPNTTTKPKGYTFCQKGADGSFGQPTVYGHISLTNVIKNQALEEVDAMIATLTKR